jgi:hypothetical protein
MPRIITFVFLCVFSLSSCEGLPIEIAVTFVPAGTFTPTTDIHESGTPVNEPTKEPNATKSTPTPLLVDPKPSVTATYTTQPSAIPTLTKTIVPSATPTNTSTKTVVPSPTPISTKTPTLTPTNIVWPYQIQPESPVYIQNFANPDEGCDWLGVAGQVFDSSGNPENYMVVLVEEEYNGVGNELIGMTGMAEDYGPGGYEIIISNEVFESEDEIAITLFDINGNQLSDRYWLTTYEDCEKNLLLINFIEK